MPPVSSTEGGAGAGEGAWVKLAGCRGAGAAAGIGEANGRAEDCAEGAGAQGEAVRMETGTSAAQEGVTAEDPFLGRGASLLRAGLGTLTAVSIEVKAAGSLRAGGGGRLATVVPFHSSLSM